jgi:hypothetical protein
MQESYFNQTQLSCWNTTSEPGLARVKDCGMVIVVRKAQIALVPGATIARSYGVRHKQEP